MGGETVRQGDGAGGRLRAAHQDGPGTSPRSRWSATVALGLAAAYVVLSYGIMFLDQRIFDPMISEDSWVESVGAAAFLAASVLFLLYFLTLVRHGGVRSAPLKAAVLLGLSVAFFVGAGEEVSWGQRLVGFATPESLEAVNRQDEFNVHNVRSVGRAVELFFALLWGTLAVVVPVASRASRRLARLLHRVVPVFPLGLGMLFVLNYLVARLAYVVVPSASAYESIYPAVHSVTEIKETNFAVLFALAAVYCWQRARVRSGVITGP